jgi:hypothetical protein
MAEYVCYEIAPIRATDGRAGFYTDGELRVLVKGSKLGNLLKQAIEEGIILQETVNSDPYESFLRIAEHDEGKGFMKYFGNAMNHELLPHLFFVQKYLSAEPVAR